LNAFKVQQELVKGLIQTAKKLPARILLSGRCAPAVEGFHLTGAISISLDGYLCAFACLDRARS
jgi:hypothetical protein